jgi:hypothetical protein
MRRLVLAGVLSVGLGLALGVDHAGADQPTNPDCWGVVSAEFAQTGGMGAHASEQETPRLGLRNLARTLLGPDATMQDLGAAVGDCGNGG